MNAAAEPLTIDVVSDVVCPWCFLGKRRLDTAIRAASDGAPIAVRWRPFQLDPSIPAGGMDRRAYMKAKFNDDARLAAIHDRLTDIGARGRHRLRVRPHRARAQHARRASPDPLGERRRQAGRGGRAPVPPLFRGRPRRRRSQAADRGRARVRHGRRTASRSSTPTATTSIRFRRRSPRRKRSASAACRSSSSPRASGCPARRTPRCSPRRSRRRARRSPASRSPDRLSSRLGERRRACRRAAAPAARRSSSSSPSASDSSTGGASGDSNSAGVTAAAWTGGASNSSSAAATASISSGA